MHSFTTIATIIAGLSSLALAAPANDYKPAGCVPQYPIITPTPTCPTICIDKVNECGQKYGGCVPHCPGEPLPEFSKPPCVCTQTVCIDNINECGIMFGGCVEHCSWMPWPTFSTPPCPPTYAAATPTPHY